MSCTKYAMRDYAQLFMILPRNGFMQIRQTARERKLKVGWDTFDLMAKVDILND